MLADYLKVLLSTCKVFLLYLFKELLFFHLLLLVLALVNVVEDWILDASEGEPAVKYSSTVLLVPLSKSWVLMELS